MATNHFSILKWHRYTLAVMHLHWLDLYIYADVNYKWYGIIPKIWHPALKGKISAKTKNVKKNR